MSRKLSLEEKKQMEYLKYRRDYIVARFTGELEELNEQMEQVRSGWWLKMQKGEKE